MNKKEVLEIRKLFKPDNCRIDRIAGCYVNGQKETVLQMSHSFLNLPEEEIHKYAELFMKALSGSVGKNLLNLEFPLAAELGEGSQSMLLALRDSALQDAELLDRFYEKVISSYLYAENYLILLAHGSYDVPGRTSDREELDDASDYVYSFVVCAVCPVVLSKAGLSYDPDANDFTRKEQDRMVQPPETGFLFPAFNDRDTDIHNMLYFTRSPEALHPEIILDLLGCELPLPAGEQKKVFNLFVEDTFAANCDFETVRAVHENLNALLEGKKEEPEPTPLQKADIRALLSSSGADEEQLARFDAAYEQKSDADDHILASNIANTRKFEIRSADVRITVDPARTDLIETHVIDGRECLVIPITDGVEVNGIRIRSFADEE